MRTEIEIIGIARKQGVGDDGKPYDYYKVHIAFDDKWTTGRAVATVSMTPATVESASLIIGRTYDAVLVCTKGRYKAYIV